MLRYDWGQFEPHWECAQAKPTKGTSAKACLESEQASHFFVQWDLIEEGCGID
jgi:hypothetical protein